MASAQTSKNQAPYGSWKSPISSSLIAQAGISFQEIHTDQHPDHASWLYWVEVRPREGGVYQVCRQRAGLASPLAHTDLLPAGFSARTRVHEYGGGSICLARGSLIFSNDKDAALYSLQLSSSGPSTESAHRLSKEGTKRRFADMHYSFALDTVFSVCEDHSATPEAANSIAAIPLDAKLKEQGETILLSGSDFYSNPRVSPNGNLLAWVEWKHPNMPWNNTTLWVSELSRASNAIALVEGSRVQVAGIDANPLHTIFCPPLVAAPANEGSNGAGSPQPDSVLNPVWLSDSELLYISDRSGFYNLYYARVTKEGGKLTVKSHAIHTAEADCAGPQWVFGGRPLVVDPTSRRVFLIVYEHPHALLCFRLDESGQVEEKTRMTTAQYTLLRSLDFLPPQNSNESGTLFAIASSPRHYSTLLELEIASTSDTPSVRCIKTSNSFKLDDDSLSEPEEVRFPVRVLVGEKATQPDHSYGYFYPPKSAGFEAPAGEMPPLLVLAHGGPTAATNPELNLKVQYYTTRGFGVLDVNYRGSSGRGRLYRDALRLQWGVYDVSDCCAGALWLAEQKRVDRKRLAIAGGSAGGYVVLASLAFYPDVFSVGASHYGIGDIELLCEETHKFESRYQDWLVGVWPTERALFRERSPIHSVNKIACPVILFQGDEDKIVTPGNSEKMFQVLKEKGLPCTYILFKGEQHGFRRAENIERSIELQYAFFARVFHIESPDVSPEALTELAIANADRLT